MNSQQQKVSEAVRALDNATNELYKASQAVTLAKRTVRSMCKHDGESTFNPDPSGNNDSSRTCHICGDEF